MVYGVFPFKLSYMQNERKINRNQALPSHEVKPYVGSSIRYIGYPHRNVALYNLFYSYIKIDKPSDDDKPTTQLSSPFAQGVLLL